MPPLPPAVHTIKEQQMYGTMEHTIITQQLNGEHDQVSVVLFVSLANYSLTLSQFYLIVRCAVWGHTKDHCLAFFYLSIYGFVLHHELRCFLRRRWILVDLLSLSAATILMLHVSFFRLGVTRICCQAQQ
jgi:hypothetical protein